MRRTDFLLAMGEPSGAHLIEVALLSVRRVVFICGSRPLWRSLSGSIGAVSLVALDCDASRAQNIET